MLCFDCNLRWLLLDLFGFCLFAYLAGAVGFVCYLVCLVVYCGCRV